MTSSLRGAPTEILLGTEDGMMKTCAVNLDRLQTVPKKNFGARITSLIGQKLDQVNVAIVFALGLSGKSRSILG
ncbi:MAG: hypothetical protein SGI88_11365 [Candidatus Hydrogenedentes bacterium]|nr:hypothetical protein [Candidatus Hydrogenedentota bacterium]